jgi:hypothetical protein
MSDFGGKMRKNGRKMSNFKRFWIILGEKWAEMGI